MRLVILLPKLYRLKAKRDRAPWPSRRYDSRMDRLRGRIEQTPSSVILILKQRSAHTFYEVLRTADPADEDRHDLKSLLDSWSLGRGRPLTKSPMEKMWLPLFLSSLTIVRRDGWEAQQMLRVFSQQPVMLLPCCWMFFFFGFALKSPVLSGRVRAGARDYLPLERFYCVSWITMVVEAYCSKFLILPYI
jgi:hypothetical protein